MIYHTSSQQNQCYTSIKFTTPPPLLHGTGITCQGILEHDWIRNYADLPDDDFGEDYRQEIRAWVHRKKFKSAISQELERCDLLKKEILKTLDDLSVTLQQVTIPPEAYNFLKRQYLQKVGGQSKLKVGLDFTEFCEVLKRGTWDVFAKPEIFDIFDMDGNGKVDYREVCTKIYAKS